MITSFHKYDAIAPRIRAMVGKIKYGGKQPADLIAMLRHEADEIEREITTERNNQHQTRMDL